jgi:lipopolysaccharide export system ATP-binding protein
MTAALEARDLVKQYGGRTVLDDLSLTVNPSRVVGLLGPNGAGKTTAFKLILGVEPADGGSVRFGAPLDGLPLYKRVRRGLGYLPQNPSVFRGLTVEDNLLAVLIYREAKAPRRALDALLDRFNLRKSARDKAAVLSGGERRKLEFARALAAGPKMLLCDEPFAGVDPIAAEEIAENIRELARDGIGVLMTDHNVRAALKVCDEVSILIDGRIEKRGTPDEIRKSARIRQRYLGSGF